MLGFVCISLSTSLLTHSIIPLHIKRERRLGEAKSEYKCFAFEVFVAVSKRW